MSYDDYDDDDDDDYYDDDDDDDDDIEDNDTFSSLDDNDDDEGNFDDDDDDNDDDDSYALNVGDYKCGTCEHWGGRRCFDSGNNNPHYYNNDRMSAYDGCENWKKSYKAKMAEEYERKEREREEQERKEREERERKERERREREERERKEREELERKEREERERREREERERKEREHQEWLKTEEGQKWLKDEAFSLFNTTKAKIPTMRTADEYDDLGKEFAGIGETFKSLPDSFGVQAQIEESETFRKYCEEKKDQCIAEETRRKAEEEQRRLEEEARKAKEAAEKKAREEKKKKIKVAIIIAVIFAAIGIPLGYIAYNNQENSVIIPNGVTIIKEGEFARKRLVSVEIPDSVTSIGNNAFKRNKLTSVEIPGSVTFIGGGAFADNQLTNITIGSKVTIGSNAFDSGFEAAYRYNDMGAGTYKRFDTQSATWNVWYGNFEYQNNGGNIAIISYDGNDVNVEIPAKIYENPVTVIKSTAFHRKNLTNVTIPNSVTFIENNAFSFNYMNSVTIPDSVTSIGVNAFALNPITSVRIGANVKLAEEPGADGAGVLGRRTGFNGAYANSGKRAGTYTRPNTDSTKWTRR